MFLPWQALSSVPGPSPQAAGLRGDPRGPRKQQGCMAGSQVQMSFGGGISVSPPGPPEPLLSHASPAYALPPTHPELPLPPKVPPHGSSPLPSRPLAGLTTQGRWHDIPACVLEPLAGSGYPRAPAHVPRSPLCLQPPEPVRSMPPVLCPPGQHTLPSKVISVGAPGLLSWWSVLLGVRAPCPGVEIT